MNNPRKLVVARNNPFAVEHVTSLPYRFESGDWPSNLERLRQLNFRAAIVGPQGSGKTTLLEQLHEQLQSELGLRSFHVFLPQDPELHPPMLKSTFEASRSNHILLVDGMERLSFFQRRDLFRKTRSGPGIVVTAHRPCRLPTWIETHTSAELLEYVLSQLGMDDPGTCHLANRELVKSRGNIRDALRTLYDRCAEGMIQVDSR